MIVRANPEEILCNLAYIVHGKQNLLSMFRQAVCLLISETGKVPRLVLKSVIILTYSFQNVKAIRITRAWKRPLPFPYYIYIITRVYRPDSVCNHSGGKGGGQKENPRTFRQIFSIGGFPKNPGFMRVSGVIHWKKQEVETGLLRRLQRCNL